MMAFPPGRSDTWCAICGQPRRPSSAILIISRYYKQYRYLLNVSKMCVSGHVTWSGLLLISIWVPWRNVPGWNVPATERSLGHNVSRTKYPLGTDSPSQVFFWQKRQNVPEIYGTFCPFWQNTVHFLKMGTFGRKFAEDVLSKDCFVPRTVLSQGRFITKFLGRKIHRTFRSGTFRQGTKMIC
jgi:hypothetical protein